MDKKYSDKIAQEFQQCVIGTIKRLDNTETYRPFHRALLSEDALFWSRFERSFSTSFGQRVVEEISLLCALSGGASQAIRQKHTNVKIDEAYYNAINHHISSLRGAGQTEKRLDRIVDQIRNITPTGTIVERRIISDLYWVKDGIENYLSIKTVKPNIDQTAEAKRDCLILAIANIQCNAYFGLYYNPYGENKSTYAHNPPMGIFDFHNDPVVLIGKGYWDTLGGAGCYEEILSIAQSVGVETKKQIEKLK